MPKLHGFLQTNFTKVTVSGNQKASPSTEQSVKVTPSTLVRDDMLICDNQEALENFKVLGNESNKFTLELKESFFIKGVKTSYNRNKCFSGNAIILNYHFE